MLTVKPPVVNRKIHIGIVTCMWKRHNIFCVFAEGVKRLESKFNITTVVVGSEGKKSRELVGKYGFKYVAHPNLPLGAKFNAGLLALQETNVDYVMVMGSDDVISSSLLEKYLDPMTRGIDVIGILDMYVYYVKNKKLYYWGGYGKIRSGEPIGLARCISRKVLDNLKWKLWDDKINKSLDFSMWQKIKGYKRQTINLNVSGTFAVDIKGAISMTSFKKLKMKEVKLTTMRKNLGRKELLLISKF
jgi:hypothetical protein